ncbi:unnamed protein product [Closterium sp. Naga37s-1]|nr:unnamed protein product [Closterium sp. Naga37s-1]
MGIARWFWDTATGVAGTGGAGEAEGAGGAAAESRTGKPSEDATLAVTATGRRAAPALAIDIRGGGSSSGALGGDGDKAASVRTALYPSARSEGGGGERSVRDVLIVEGGRPPADAGRARGGVFRKKQRRGKGKRSVFVYELVRAPAGGGGGDYGGRGLPRARTAGAAESGSAGLWGTDGAEGVAEGAMGKAQGWQQRSLDRSDTQSDIADVDEWRREMEKYLTEKLRRESGPKEMGRKEKEVTREERESGGSEGEQHERENGSGGGGSWGLRDADDDDLLGASGRACNAYGGCDEGNNSWRDTSSEGEAAGIDQWDLDADIEEHHSEDESSAVLSAATSGDGGDPWGVGGSSGSEEQRALQRQGRDKGLVIDLGVDGEELGVVRRDEDWFEEAEGVLLVDEGRVVPWESDGGERGRNGEWGRSRSCVEASVRQASRTAVARAAADAQAGRRGDGSDGSGSDGSTGRGSDSSSRHREGGRPVLLRCEGVRGSNRVRAFDPSEYLPAPTAPAAPAAPAAAPTAPTAAGGVPASEHHCVSAGAGASWNTPTAAGAAAVPEGRETAAQGGARARARHAAATSAAAGKSQHVSAWWQFGGADKSADKSDSSGQAGRRKSTGGGVSSGVHGGRSRPLGPPPTPQSPDHDACMESRTSHLISPPALPSHASAASSSRLLPSPRLPPSRRLRPSPGLRRQQSAAASLAAVEASQRQPSVSASAKPRPLSRANSAAPALLHPQPILLAGGKRFSTRCPAAAAAAAAAAAVVANGGGANAAAAAAAANGAGAVAAANSGGGGGGGAAAAAAAATGKARAGRAAEAAGIAGGKGAVGLKASAVVYHPPFSSYRHQADVAAQEEEASLRELEQQLERERRRREEEEEEDLLAEAGERGVREVRVREGEWEEGGAWMVKMPGRGESRRLEELCEKVVGMGAGGVGMGLDGVEMCLELERGVVSIGPSVGGRGGMGRSLSMGMGSSPEAMPDARGRERVGVMQGGREHAVTSPAPVPPPMRRSRTDTRQERRAREQQEQMGACVKQDLGMEAAAAPPMRRSRTDTRQERQATEQQEQRDQLEQMGVCVKQDVGLVPMPPPMRRSRTDTRQERGMRAGQQAMTPAVRGGGRRSEGCSRGEAGSGRVLRRGKTQPSRRLEQREGVARRREGDLLIRTHTLGQGAVDSGHEAEGFGSEKGGRGCPGAERRCPGAERGCPGAERGCPGAERGCPGAERGCPGAERGCPGAERGCPGAERGCPSAERGCPGAERGCPGAGGGVPLLIRRHAL